LTHGPRKKVPNNIWATVANHLTIIQLNLKNPQLVNQENRRPVNNVPIAAGITMKSSMIFMNMKHTGLLKLLL